MKSASAVISLLCLVAIFQSCHSGKCYECNSKRDEDCSKLTYNTTYSIECPKHFQCSLKLFSEGNKYITTRNCEPKGVSHHVRTCKKNKCNYKKEKNNTLQEGEALQCYNCTSINTYNETRRNSECEKINSTKFLTNCNAGEVCGMYKARRPDGSIYILDRLCHPANSRLEVQMICYSDNCNNMEMPSVKKTRTLKRLKKMKYF